MERGVSADGCGGWGRCDGDGYLDGHSDQYSIGHQLGDGDVNGASHSDFNRNADGYGDDASHGDFDQDADGYGDKAGHGDFDQDADGYGDKAGHGDFDQDANGDGDGDAAAAGGVLDVRGGCL